MYEKTLSRRKMTNGNGVTHNTKHTILFNKAKFTPYSVPPAQAPASVYEQTLSTMPNEDLYGEIETLLKWTE